MLLLFVGHPLYPNGRATSAHELTSIGASLVAGGHRELTMSWAKSADMPPESRAFWAAPIRRLTTIVPGHLQEVTQVKTTSREVCYDTTSPRPHFLDLVEVSSCPAGLEESGDLIVSAVTGQCYLLYI